MKQISALGVASSIAGNHPDSSFGPIVLKGSSLLRDECVKHGLQLVWEDLLFPDQHLPTTLAIHQLCIRIRLIARQLVAEHVPFVSFTGDHSSAIGLWGGINSMLAENDREFGLIWIDAHMDAHNFKTTRSGNIHGMPIAALLGHHDRQMASICNWLSPVAPNRLVLVGVRSFEMEEHELLSRLGVRVYYMDDIYREGLNTIMRRAINQVSRNNTWFGVSLDLDALDPRDMPAVSTPEGNGIRGAELSEALRLLHRNQQFLGLEIAEFCPTFDHEHMSEYLIGDLVTSVYAEEESDRRPNKSLGSDRSGNMSNDFTNPVSRASS